MHASKPAADSKLSRANAVETSLIVGLAALVVIKGGGAVAGVFLGIGQMMAAVVSALAG
ncbi:hypothetical protein [Brevundimonas sp. Root1423]|uniref:hypothetical protein n=1 Tax=Brevundimonas sp. Root1423 TaxID=1736462 RepID=UPI000A420353|nr:hypothetical protein [Brevundimonas sp. Root1423]